MFVDNVTIIVRAGDGGHGAATFKRTAQTSRGGPDGGNGGHGGDIFFQGSFNVNDLSRFRYKKKILGNPGGPGTKHNGFGKNAEDIIVDVPVGTRITNVDTGHVVEIDTTEVPVLVARGGRGGYGNVKYKSATNQAPKNRELGFPGEVKNLHLELRLIADIGLVGLPNAGKSSLLTALTNATPAIGNYPFTTLTPNIGMLANHGIADIPGLIEGASQGVGLGTKFLKHIEKTRILVHCIDITHENPLSAYNTVRKEFKQFNTELLEKPEIIFLNKTDLVSKKEIETATGIFTALGKPVFTGSTHNENEMKTLAAILSKAVQKNSFSLKP